MNTGQNISQTVNVHFAKSLTLSLLFTMSWIGVGSYADNGGSFVLPELDSGLMINIEDEDMPEFCMDSDWPEGIGEVLPLSLSPLLGASDPPTGQGKMLIYHPDDPMIDSHIYFYFSVEDDVSHSTEPNMDSLMIRFDLAHDEDVAETSSFDDSDDRGIRFNRDGTVERVYGDTLSPDIESSTDDSMSFEMRTCVSDSGEASWEMEAAILPEDLGLSHFNHLMSAAIFVTDGANVATERSAWPPALGTAVVQENWAHLITRSPIDFVLLIDQSGSMSGDNKWDSVKQAGNNFRGMLAQFQDAELNTEFSDSEALNLNNGGDRIGLITFTSSEPGNDRVFRELTAVASTPSDYTGNLPDNPGGSTPMVAGVDESFYLFSGLDEDDPLNLFNGSALAESDHDIQKVVRQKVVMLLSDGKHNTPSTEINFNTEGNDSDSETDNFDYLPDDCLSEEVDSLVRINTAAIGTDATVNPDTLNEIKNCFSGSHYTNYYNITETTESELTASLSKFYFQTIYPYYQLNEVTRTGGDVNIKAGEKRLLFFAFWADSSSVDGLEVTLPDSSVASITPGGSVSNADDGECPEGLGYCYLFFENPMGGVYTNYAANGALPMGQYTLIDLRVEARFSLDNQPHGTNSTITLKARLQEDGQPILNADVSVDVRKPEEGFGTVASTLDLETCEPTRPRLPNFDSIGRTPDTLARVAPTPGIGGFAFSSANLLVQGQTQNNDVNPPAYALMEQLLSACGLDGLGRGEDSDLQLFDDGTNGDETADDGLYTLVFDQAEIEGSHVFDFTARGTMADGASFQRIKEIGEYVYLEVDSGSSEVGDQILNQSGNQFFRVYYVVPRDIHGGYLGPGHVEEVDFLVGNAQPVGDVLDFNNGMYAQMVQYDSNDGEPSVVPVVQDKPIIPEAMPPVTSPDFWEKYCLWLLLILAFLVLLLAFLLLLCRLRKR